MAPKTDHVTEEDRLRIWNEILDGGTVNSMRRYWVEHLSVGVVKSVLEEEPPEAIRNDQRYIQGGRFFWICASASDAIDSDGKPMAFVVVKMPYRLNRELFAKGVRAIRRAFRAAHPGGDLELAVIEGVEADVALRFATVKGYDAWQIDAEGGVRSLEIVPTPGDNSQEETAPTSGPRP